MVRGVAFGSLVACRVRGDGNGARCRLRAKDPTVECVSPGTFDVLAHCRGVQSREAIRIPTIG